MTKVMKKTHRWLSLFGLLMCLTTVLSKPAETSDETDYLLHKTLTALRGILEYFNSEYKNINLDAAIGTRIVEGK